MNYLIGLFILLVALSCSDETVPDKTAFTVNNVQFSTSDGLSIKGSYYEPSVAFKHAIILIHSFGATRNEWNFFAESLADTYVVLSYDIRGHGLSDKIPSLPDILTNPNTSPFDLQAAIAFLNIEKKIDTNHIAVIGSSIGANLAYVASSEYGVKSTVAFSGKTSAVFSLSGKNTLKMQTVFCIASSGDDGGNRETWAKQLYNMVQGKRKLYIDNSDRHGAVILVGNDDLSSDVKNWLNETLNDIE